MNYILLSLRVCSSVLTLSFQLLIYSLRVSSMLSSANVCCDLRLQMSMDLSWSTHYSTVCYKAYKFLALLRRMFGKFGSVEATRSLFSSSLFSIMESTFNKRHYHT